MLWSRSVLSGYRSTILTTMLVLAVGACTQGGRTLVTATTPDSASPATARRAIAWPMRVREHVDLWLHGFAMLHQDSSLVPYFRPGYRERLMGERQRANATTLLDAHGDRLRQRLAANPAMINAQFAALYFDDWTLLRRGVSLFLEVQGDARRAGDQESALAVATLNAYFPTAADREWLATFVQALEDERTRFYAAYWRAEQRRQGPVFDRADVLWREYLPRFSTFLTNSRQRTGQVLLALALAGEGRTLMDGNRGNTVTVGFPTDTTRAEELVYVFAHEIVGSVANAVVTDNTSPAERRSGAADQYASLAAVRGGALLLRRVAPELTEEYQRYYLALAGIAPPPGTAVEQRFAATFPLPEALGTALDRQIDIILGGI